MDKTFILSRIIDEYQKVVANLKSSVDLYKFESDMDEDNTLDPDDYARQNEAKDMQLRFQKMLNQTQQNLKFLEEAKADIKENAEVGALIETDKNYLFIGVSVPVFQLEDKEVISFSEDAPIFKSVKNKKIGDIFEIGKNKFEIKQIN
jgi:hypothetical protein